MWLTPEWIQLIEADAETLRELRSKIPESSAFSRPMMIYLETLIAYLGHDLAGLRECLQKAGTLDDSPLALTLQDLIHARLQIRQREINPETLSRLLAHVNSAQALKGEIFFVAALVAETNDDPASARDLYRKAAAALQECGAARKAVKASLNELACETRVHPEKKLLADYIFISRRARKLGQDGVAGVAFLNISREYQELGALRIALKYCNHSLVLQRKETGTLPYFLTLAHRAHLLAALGRVAEASLDLERVLAAGFPEASEALKVVEAILRQDSSTADLSKLTPTWRERALNLQKGRTSRRLPVLGELEQRLLELLSAGPSDKFTLIHAIYGEKIAFLVADNRFKVLLNRLRRKHPGLVVLENGAYRIADETLVPEAG